MHTIGLMVAIVLLHGEAQGCHEYRHVRSKRQSSFGDPARREADNTRKLRKYFATCMEGKVGAIWAWGSVIDYTILDTFWYQNTAQSNCSRNSDDDSSGCWKTRLQSLLSGRYALFTAAEACIDQFSKDTTSGRRYRRQADDALSQEFCRPPSDQRFRPNSNQVKTYTLCGESETEFPSYRPAVDFPSVLEFVGDHTLCGSELTDCNSNNQETLTTGDPDVAKWPYRFEAITKDNSPFKPAIVSCNAKIFPLKTGGAWSAWSDCTATCGGGTRSRTRSCNEVKDCNNSDQEECNTKLCKNCRISSVSRKPCGAGLTSRQECVALGCCYDGGSCYRSEEPASFEQPNFQATSSPEISLGGDDGFPGNRIQRRCDPIAPCTRTLTGTDSESCWKAGCCWISNRCAGYTFKVTTIRDTCPPGFANPPACRDIDECASNPCPPPLICNDLINSYSCSCPPGVSSPNCVGGGGGGISLWGSWSSWGTCSPSCGTGMQTRTRTCLGTSCSGASTQQQSCSLGTCALLLGAWSSWSTWGTCLTLCGGGTQTRTRTCLTPPCSGGSTEFQSCVGAPCDCTTAPPYTGGSIVAPPCSCSYSSGTTYYYACARSCAVLSGGLSTTCINGVWTTPALSPVCTLIPDCPSVPATENRPQPVPASCIGDTVHFACVAGVLVGPSTATCQASGVWSQFPFCSL